MQAGGLHHNPCYLRVIGDKRGEMAGFAVVVIARITVVVVPVAL